MATIQFDLVSPERKLASLEASEIQIPGSDGDFTAMAEHAPVLTTLKPGLLSVKVVRCHGIYVTVFVNSATMLCPANKHAKNEVDTAVLKSQKNATAVLKDVLQKVRMMQITFS